MSTSFSFWYLEYSLNNIQIHGLNGGAILTTGSEVIFCVKLYLLITGFHVSLALHLLETSGAVADSICTASSFFFCVCSTLVHVSRFSSVSPLSYHALVYTGTEPVLDLIAMLPSL